MLVFIQHNDVKNPILMLHVDEEKRTVNVFPNDTYKDHLFDIAKMSISTFDNVQEEADYLKGLYASLVESGQTEEKSLDLLKESLGL